MAQRLLRGPLRLESHHRFCNKVPPIVVGLVQRADPGELLLRPIVHERVAMTVVAPKMTLASLERDPKKPEAVVDGGRTSSSPRHHGVQARGVLEQSALRERKHESGQIPRAAYDTASRPVGGLA